MNLSCIPKNQDIFSVKVDEPSEFLISYPPEINLRRGYSSTGGLAETAGQRCRRLSSGAARSGPLRDFRGGEIILTLRGSGIFPENLASRKPSSPAL